MASTQDVREASVTPDRSTSGPLIWVALIVLILSALTYVGIVVVLPMLQGAEATGGSVPAAGSDETVPGNAEAAN